MRGGEHDRYDKIFGLERFRLTKQLKGLENFKTGDGSEPQVLLRCNSQVPAPHNPLCDGHVLYARDGLAFHIVFGKPFLRHWRETIGSARELIQSWRVP